MRKLLVLVAALGVLVTGQSVYAVLFSPSCTLSANPSSITSGQISTLSWTSTAATSGSIDNGVGAMLPISSGSKIVTPSQTTTYTGTVVRTTTTGTFSATCTKTIVVASSQPSAPTVTISATPTAITLGQSAVLSWSSTNATSCTASGGWIGSPGTSGSQSVSPSSTTTYTLTCTGSGGSAISTVTVAVTALPPAPTCTLSAVPSSILLGSSSTLSWITQNATSGSIDQGVGAMTPLTSGSKIVTPTATTTYSASVTGVGGSAQCSVTVGVVLPTPEAGIFKPESYGANADGVTDSTLGIRQAIQAAIAYGPGAKIQLASGTYKVSCMPGVGQDNQFCFALNAAKGITIQGAGSSLTKFIVSTPTSGLFFVAYDRYGPVTTPSENVVFQGFSIDYDPLPYTQGKIVAVGVEPNTIDVAIDAGYPLPGSPTFAPQIYSYANTYGMIISPTSARLKPHVDTAFFTVFKNQVSGNTWRLSDPGGKITSQAAVNDRYVQLGGRAGSDVIKVAGANNVTVKDVVMYSAAGIGTTWITNTGTMNIDGLQMRIKPGTNRLLSGNSNVTIFIHNWANAIIQNSYFEGNADDAIDIGSSGNLLKSVISDTKFTMEDTWIFKAGDIVQVVDPCGTARGEAVISNITIDQPYVAATVTLATPILGMKSSGGVASCTLGGNSPLAAFDSDIVYDASASSRNSEIKNNIFNFLRGSLYVHGWNYKITNNNFLDFEGSITIGFANEWRGGPIPRDITISGNQMAKQYDWPGFIYVSSPKGGISNVTISNNQFSDTQVHAIVVNGASNVQLTNNTVTNSSIWPLSLGSAQLLLDRVVGVVVNGFNIFDTRVGAGPGVRIEQGVAEGPLGVSITGLTTPPSPYVSILDLRPPSTLVGYWKLNETSGTAVSDSSGNNLSGTLVGGAGTTTGKLGGAIYLDGVNDYVSIPDNALLEGQSAFTLAGWVKLDQLPLQNIIPFGKEVAYRLVIGSNGAGHVAIATTNNGWYTAGTVAGFGPGAVTPGSWVHLATTYDGSTVKVYVNGVLAGVGSPTISGTVVNNANPLAFGRNSPGANNVEFTKGAVDDVRLYNRALTAAEITALYSSY